MSEEPNLKPAQQSIKEMSKVVKWIEPFAKKASREIKKGTFLGVFYIAVTLILIAIFVIISIGLIIGINTLFPKEYRWMGYVVSIIPLIALYMLARKSLQLTNN